MPKTAVGLFKSPGVPDEVVRDIESIGFSRNEVRTLDEPPEFGLSEVMSIPRIDFDSESPRRGRDRRNPGSRTGFTRCGAREHGTAFRLA
jgi:hypothetical protein